MKKPLSLFRNLILIVVLSNFLISCAPYYRYQPNVDKLRYANKNTQNWVKLDQSNYLVVHSGDQMMEFYDVSLDEEDKRLSGKLRPFHGLPFEEYNRIADKAKKEKIKRAKGKEAKSAIQQVHFMVAGDLDLSTEDISFELANVYLVNVSKNAASTGSKIALFATAGVVLYVGVSFLCWCQIF